MNPDPLHIILALIGALFLRTIFFNRRTLPLIGHLLTTKKQRKFYAYHEAGHALAAIILDYGKELQSISLSHTHTTFGQTRTKNKDTHIDIEQAKNWIICELAGEAAENLLADTPYKKRRSAAHDHKIAQKIAQHIPRTENNSNQELLETAQQQAHQIMEENKETLNKIAQALLEKNTLSAAEIYKISDLKQP